MTTATRPRCPVTWHRVHLCPVHGDDHACGRAVDDHDDGLHVCDCGATYRVTPTRGERP